MSRRAASKPARGGAPNFLAVRASVETLPSELCGVASEVRIILPWGSLLRAVASPDIDLLRGIRSLCHPGANLEVAFSLDPCRDAAALDRLDLGAMDDSHFHALRAGYGEAGFDLTTTESLGREGLRSLGTTWAAKLAHGVPRAAWRLSAIAAMPTTHRE